MFEGMSVEFWYLTGQKAKRISFANNYINKDFEAIVGRVRNNSSEKLRLSIVPCTEITILKLCIDLPYTFNKNHRIFVNGYQSWTDSREMLLSDKMNNISMLAAPLIKKYQLNKYGDYTFKHYSRKKGEFHGYTYTYIRKGKKLDLIGSLSERAGFTIIEQHTGKNRIIINKECEGLSISELYIPFELFYACGSEKEVFDAYFEEMRIRKPRFKPSTGWTSWYNYYQNINQAIILENLENFTKYNKKIDFFQIDDGYQSAVGDWLDVDKGKFPDGMEYISEKIRKKGYKAGIWLAPFVCEAKSRIFKEKREWLLKDHKGQLVAAGSNWSGFYVLDIYNTEVRDYIKKVFSVILDVWEYDMVKLDFLYAVCLLPRKDKTRGQIMTEAMEFLRECVGEKIILACGVPLGPAFGISDYCRIGCDVGLDWNDKFYMRKLHRERVSTLNAIGNAIARRQLDGRAFLNDPDVFLLRQDNISLSNSQKETLAVINNMFGSLLFTSDNIKYYSKEQFDLFDRIMQIKKCTIEYAESFANGLVEIAYDEQGTSHLLLINLNSKTLMFSDYQLMPYSCLTLEL